MGSSHSVHEVVEEEEESESEEEEEDEREEDGDGGGPDGRRARSESTQLVKKVLEQEPEMLPCHPSASPLSPQLSSLGTPRLGPSIKVWDPYNVLAPPPPLPPPPPIFSRSFSMEADDRQPGVTEVFLISHGECELSMRPDLIGGRCPEAALTPNGKRQARALAVFLNSHGVRFGSVFSSPLDRARSMAALVCQVIDQFPELVAFIIWVSSSCCSNSAVQALLRKVQQRICCLSPLLQASFSFRDHLVTLVMWVNSILGCQEQKSLNCGHKWVAFTGRVS